MRPSQGANCLRNADASTAVAIPFVRTAASRRQTSRRRSFLNLRARGSGIATRNPLDPFGVCALFQDDRRGGPPADASSTGAARGGPCFFQRFCGTARGRCNTWGGGFCARFRSWTPIFGRPRRRLTQTGARKVERARSDLHPNSRVVTAVPPISECNR